MSIAELVTHASKSKKAKQIGHLKKTPFWIT